MGRHTGGGGAWGPGDPFEAPGTLGQGSRSLNAGRRRCLRKWQLRRFVVMATNCCEKYDAKWVLLFMLQRLAALRICSRLRMELPLVLAYGVMSISS